MEEQILINTLVSAFATRIFRFPFPAEFRIGLLLSEHNLNYNL